MSSENRRTSGNPATQSQINQTVKQQREQKRQEKLAEYQRQLAKRRRSKLLWWVVGGTAGLAIVALVAASFIFAPQPAPTYPGANASGTEIEGVETFDLPNNHVEGAVTYEQTPPAGGPHNAVWLNCGVYTEPQANENAVHAMEHGAVWVTYDADAVSDEELATLKSKLPATYMLLSPYEGLDSPIVLSAWNHQLKLDSADDPRIEQFFTEYWRSQNAPEPNAVCSGAIDGPGKL
ncbi:uncharacterized protein DUF3105 [Microbacterium sp. AG1240]|uniref:DUF3105 domain-containing protein n=1 Tax=Microbacterium sp. AG1240 TaxID=2183992 RepID=UPI000EABA934|nr:DUF3105 domain-containing protein [Microbacterium sp. AG1240]RKT33326.1 uncharacterized protein DUF3105 [Microbacterium sp. AG1240]